MPLQAPAMFATHGRDREWAELTDALARSGWGGSRGLIIEGARGRGRTRMLRAVAAAADRAGRVVRTPPGWTVEAIDQLAAELTELAERLQPPQPFVVTWDDPPWADPGFLPALERAMAEAPAFWVLTRATTAGSGQHTLPPAHTHCVELGRLTDAATAAMAADLLGAPLSAPLRELTAVAGGTAGLLVELLAGLFEEDLIELGPLAGLRELRLPARTVSSLRHAIGQLSSDARYLVQVASVVDGNPSLADLAELLETTAVSLVPAVVEAMEANFFRHDSELLVFSHGLVRELVGDSVPRAVWRPVRDAGARLGTRGPHRPGPQLPGPDPVAKGSIDVTGLTRAELDVAQLVREGLSNKQVGRRLHVTHHTVNYHLRAIYRKLGVNGRVDLARLPWPQPPAAA